MGSQRTEKSTGARRWVPGWPACAHCGAHLCGRAPAGGGKMAAPPPAHPSTTPSRPTACARPPPVGRPRHRPHRLPDHGRRLPAGAPGRGPAAALQGGGHQPVRPGGGAGGVSGSHVKEMVRRRRISVPPATVCPPALFAAQVFPALLCSAALLDPCSVCPAPLCAFAASSVPPCYSPMLLRSCSHLCAPVILGTAVRSRASLQGAGRGWRAAVKGPWGGRKNWGIGETKTVADGS